MGDSGVSGGVIPAAEMAELNDTGASTVVTPRIVGSTLYRILPPRKIHALNCRYTFALIGPDRYLASGILLLKVGHLSVGVKCAWQRWPPVTVTHIVSRLYGRGGTKVYSTFSRALFSPRSPFLLSFSQLFRIELCSLGHLSRPEASLPSLVNHILQGSQQPQLPRSTFLSNFKPTPLALANPRRPLSKPWAISCGTTGLVSSPSLPQSVSSCPIPRRPPVPLTFRASFQTQSGLLCGGYSTASSSGTSLEE